MDVISNNLANASTIGFKADGLAFDDLIKRPLAGPNGQGQIGYLGSGSALYDTYSDQKMGEMTNTGNPFDLAITSKTEMFAVDTGSGVAYTRNGSFTVIQTSNPGEMQLVTKEGMPVLDSNLQPIAFKRGEMAIGSDGKISIDGNPGVSVGMFTGKFSKSSEGSTLFVSNDAVQAGPDASLKQGALEGSNVNPIASMVMMIGVQRAFELGQKTIQSQDEETQKLFSVLQG